MRPRSCEKYNPRSPPLARHLPLCRRLGGLEAVNLEAVHLSRSIRKMTLDINDDNHHYHPPNEACSCFLEDDGRAPPLLHTLDFAPGTLSIFSGSKSLHRVTRVLGPSARLVAVLTFASEPDFCNSPEVQRMFWGRSSASPKC